MSLEKLEGLNREISLLVPNLKKKTEIRQVAYTTSAR